MSVISSLLVLFAFALFCLSCISYDVYHFHCLVFSSLEISCVPSSVIHILLLIVVSCSTNLSSVTLNIRFSTQSINIRILLDAVSSCYFICKDNQCDPPASLLNLHRVRSLLLINILFHFQVVRKFSNLKNCDKVTLIFHYIFFRYLSFKHYPIVLFIAMLR